MFVYLAPNGQIPSFAADEIPALPETRERGKAPEPYRKGIPHGTCIKVYAYNWTARSLATTNAREELEKYLYTLALPIRISETRDYSAAGDEDAGDGGTHYFQTTLSGLSVNIVSHRESKRGSRIEEGFCQLPMKLSLPDIGELGVAVTVYRDRDDFEKPFDTKRIPHGVLFTVNGQVHHRAAADFIKDKLGYPKQ